jgi:hypothetical protein
MKPNDIHPTKLLELARYHVKHFDNMLALHAKGVIGFRVKECEHYKAVWTSVETKANQAVVLRKPLAYTTLTPTESQEVWEAIDSGDFDTMLGLEPTHE